MSPKSFYAQKLDWLVEVAGTPGISVRAISAAVACADGAFAPGEVKLRQRELAEKLGRPQSAVSAGCNELLALGFLTSRSNGNRRIYALSFDRNSRKAPHKRALKGKLRLSAVADEGISATPDIAPCIRPGGSTSSARADEHYNRLSEGEVLETPVREPCERSSAPVGARRLHGRIVAAIEESFDRVLHPHQEASFLALVDQIGQAAVYSRLHSYRDRLSTGAIAPVSIARWLRQAGLLEVRHVA